MNPNSFDQELKDAQNAANLETQEERTVSEQTEQKPTIEGEQEVDYQKKFAESSKEALRLYEENKRLNEELAATATVPVTENLYPGFEELSPEAQQNLISYTDVVTKRALAGVYNDPAIKYAKEQHNISKWETAFSKVSEKYPDLKTSKDEFKIKYFKADNVPDNIDLILEDVAKIHLFDKAKYLGAEEEKKKSSRVDSERSVGGDKTPQSSRSLDDWARMANTNPAEFAQHAKEFNADMASGKLKV